MGRASASRSIPARRSRWANGWACGSTASRAACSARIPAGGNATMAVQTTRTVEELEAYCARLRAAGLDAPWSRPGPLIPPRPTATQPRHWRWRDIEPLLRASSEFLSPHQGKEGGAPVRWRDLLDGQIVRSLETLPREPYPDEQQPALRNPGRDIYFPWSEAHAALLRRAEQAPDPFDDTLLEYIDPESGSSLRPTVACYLQLLRPRAQTRAHRETSCAVYRVVQGRGVTTVDDQTFEWEPGGFFVGPPRARHAP